MQLAPDSRANARFFLMLSGVAVAMPIGLLLCDVIWLDNELDLVNDWGTVTFCILWSALPLWIALVFLDRFRRPRLAGGIALAVTALFWTAAARSVWISRQYGGGADIGLGCLLMILPGIIAVVMGAAGGRRS